MGYYKSPPVLDETEQAEFDKYLRKQYREDLQLAGEIAKSGHDQETDTVIGYFDDRQESDAVLAVFDKLATPRIYLLQAWLHKRSQEAAGVETK